MQTCTWVHFTPCKAKDECKIWPKKVEEFWNCVLGCEIITRSFNSSSRNRHLFRKEGSVKTQFVNMETQRFGNQNETESLKLQTTLAASLLQ